MSYQFPDSSQEWRAQAEAYINELKGEVERLWKRQPMTPESIGALPFDPGYGISIGEGGGDVARRYLLGKTVSSVSKGSSVSVTIYAYNGGSHTIDITSAGGSVTAWSMFGSVGANKYVGCCQDIETDQWYIVAAECGD